MGRPAEWVYIGLPGIHTRGLEHVHDGRLIHLQVLVVVEMTFVDSAEVFCQKVSDAVVVQPQAATLNQRVAQRRRAFIRVT